jgi:hypothetical protein
MRITGPALVVAPPLVAFALVWGFLAAETLGFQPLNAQPANLSEAAAMGAAASALRFIASGSNPNIAQPIAPGVLGRRPRTVNAIDAAILGRRPDMIQLLRQHGATVGDVGRSRCLAQAVAFPEPLPMLGVTAARGSAVSTGEVDERVEACLRGGGVQ